MSVQIHSFCNNNHRRTALVSLSTGRDTDNQSVYPLASLTLRSVGHSPIFHLRHWRFRQRLNSARRKIQKLEAVAATHAHAYKMAIRAGVKIALDADLGLGGVSSNHANRVFSRGRNGHELRYAVDADMTPLEAIEAATATAPETLGAQAPLSGLPSHGLLRCGFNPPYPGTHWMISMSFRTRIW